MTGTDIVVALFLDGIVLFWVAMSGALDSKYQGRILLGCLLVGPVLLYLSEKFVVA